MRPYALPGVTKNFGMELWDSRGRPRKASHRNAWKGVKVAVRREAAREIQCELEDLPERYVKRVGYRSWKGRTWHGGRNYSGYDNSYPYPYSWPDTGSYNKHPGEVKKHLTNLGKSQSEYAYFSKVKRLEKRIQSHPWLQPDLDYLRSYKGKQEFIADYIADWAENRSRPETHESRRQHERIMRDRWDMLLNNLKKGRI